MLSHSLKSIQNKSHSVANRAFAKPGQAQLKSLLEENSRDSSILQPMNESVSDPIQRQGGLEEEELLQGKFDPVQRQGGLEEEELLQGKFEPIQRMGGPEEEELMQGKFEPVQRKPNNTGMPDNLKAGIESLSGIDMSDVKVHHNSSQPAQLIQQTEAPEVKALNAKSEITSIQCAGMVVQRDPDEKKKAPPSPFRPFLSRAIMALPNAHLFAREAFAGLLGYGSHYFLPPQIPEEEVLRMSRSRQAFHRGLMRLYQNNQVPRWAHQLMHQNRMQARFGNELPEEAANVMLTNLEKLGEEAQGAGRRLQLAKHFWNYQVGSIRPFELGGSSLAPRLLHSLGVLLQMPLILAGGSKWVNRSAREAVLRGPVPMIAVAGAITLFLNSRNWRRDDSEESK